MSIFTKLLKYLGLITLQIFISIVSVFLVISVIGFLIKPNTIQNIDPIGLANTFMVFVTFIVVVGTVAITIAGIMFTSWFSRQKEAIIKDNIIEVTDALLENQSLKERVLEEILKQKPVKKEFLKLIDEHLKSQKDDFESESKQLKLQLKKDLENFEKTLRTEFKQYSIDAKDGEEINNMIGKY